MLRSSYSATSVTDVAQLSEDLRSLPALDQVTGLFVAYEVGISRVNLWLWIALRVASLGGGAAGRKAFYTNFYQSEPATIRSWWAAICAEAAGLSRPPARGLAGGWTQPKIDAFLRGLREAGVPVRESQQEE